MLTKEEIRKKIESYLAKNRNTKLSNVGHLASDIYLAQHKEWGRNKGFTYSSQVISIWCNRLGVQRLLAAPSTHKQNAEALRSEIEAQANETSKLMFALFSAPPSMRSRKRA